jgi:hypothetical protein
MADYLLLMHGDTVTALDPAAWDPYFAQLRAAGVFEGGSAIGDGTCMRKHGAPAALATQLTGYIRITATDLTHARIFVAGNPVFEAGGTIELRELPRG